MLKLSRQDSIWNRASVESGGASPAPGDQALASLLRAHNLAMNGGVAHALECLSPSETTAAIAGFNYFGLADAARVFEQAPDESEAAEERLDRMYWSVIPSDDTLAHAFRIKLISTPEAFAPVDTGQNA